MAATVLHCSAVLASVSAGNASLQALTCTHPDPSATYVLIILLTQAQLQALISASSYCSFCILINTSHCLNLNSHQVLLSNLHLLFQEFIQRGQLQRVMKEQLRQVWRRAL
jgi:hypothetical protein